MDWQSFFALHNGLLRQGPGTEADVAWVSTLTNLPASAGICDAGCGQGADIAALRAHFETARIVAIDKSPDFIARAKERFVDDPQLLIATGDLARLPGPFDLIWCAGALYFLGLQNGLDEMKNALKPGGVLAFSEPCFFTDAPSEDAAAFWDGYDTQTTTSILKTVRGAGYDILVHRPVSDAGWEAYYEPMKARIDDLRPGASARLGKTLDHCAAEADRWRRIKTETGYLLTVARAV